MTGIKSMQVQTKIKKKRNKKREEDDEKPRATTVCMHASLPQKKTAELVSERFNLRIRSGKDEYETISKRSWLLIYQKIYNIYTTLLV